VILLSFGYFSFGLYWIFVIWIIFISLFCKYLCVLVFFLVCVYCYVYCNCDFLLRPGVEEFFLAGNFFDSVGLLHMGLIFFIVIFCRHFFWPAIFLIV
jgi:hypothetical protein